MNSGFYRNNHNPSFFSGTATSYRSLFSEASALAASAYASPYATAMTQLGGRPPVLYVEVPGVHADIVPSGSTSATELSNHWVIAQVGTPNEHIMAYAADRAAWNLANIWKPTAR